MAEASPQIDYNNNEELGGDWVTCNGCPSFRVNDWHYFYCRFLGDQTMPDKCYTKGWFRLMDISFNRADGEYPKCQMAASNG